MYPRVDETPMPAEQLTGRYVYDLVYNPPMTRLLRDAGARAVRRSAASTCSSRRRGNSFEWWTGAGPQAGVMREAALKRLAEFARDENHVV